MKYIQHGRQQQSFVQIFVQIFEKMIMETLFVFE